MAMNCTVLVCYAIAGVAEASPGGQLVGVDQRLQELVFWFCLRTYFSTARAAGFS